jgi:hypothetical protein
MVVGWLVGCRREWMQADLVGVGPRCGSAGSERSIVVNLSRHGSLVMSVAADDTIELHR